MTPSRRRGPCGKTSTAAARSAAILATERGRQKEHERNSKHDLTSVNDTTKNKSKNKNNNNHLNDITSTGDLEPTTNNTTSIDDHAELGLRRGGNSILPPFGTDERTATAQSDENSSSSQAQKMAVASANRQLYSLPGCKIVPEDQHRKGICSQQSLHGRTEYIRKQKIYCSDGRNVVDGYDDDDGEDKGCLHCHEVAKDMPRIRPIDDNDDDIDIDNFSDEGYDRDFNIQVRCDDCGSYICNRCHWCHNFQANHEIRVCDKCDGFYCRGCDEMDQCDDCGEVVCGSCSTLLSCKFCGGGLCEECATACGRCGIVLCSRDAKFAVDCDNCRLSYCLVCLASGSKDPCVRCGHRPSKRMEQLVHLRLKCIYKAFKSSNSNGCVGRSSSGGDGGDRYPWYDPITSHSTKIDNSNSFDRSNKKRDGHEGQVRCQNPTTLQDTVADYDDENGGVDPAISMVMGAASGVLPEKFCHDLQQSYLAEQKKADAAAEALLAELEEEETAIAQKKSKKKKRKERKNAAKQSAAKFNVIEDDDKIDGGNAELEKTLRVNATFLDSRDDEMNTNPISETDSTEQATKVDDKLVHKMQNVEEVKIDPIEKELVECVNNVDLEGIENILFRYKGVPGRAALRKNAKKALKRLKQELNPSPHASLESKVKLPIKLCRKSTAAGKRSSSMAEKVAPDAVETKISSRKTTIKNSTSFEKSLMNNNKSSHQKSSFHKNSGTNRCEAFVEITSRLVGWMIGKNGQRIRDLMEESGAKIWIDQEKIRGQETRNVYISGDRKSVDQAVLLVNDVITNAPPPQGTTNTVATATALMANMAIAQKQAERGKTREHLSPSTLSPANVAKSSTDEVRSVWGKASGSNAGWDKTSSGTILSSSVPSTVEKVKKRSKTMFNSETKFSGAFKDQEPPGVLPDDSKTIVATTSPATISSTTRSLQNRSTEVTTEIVTCDFRFVPLLIGKRGWAIKNIQDNSGARVDIDQTVTPRQVRISGSKENVDKAVTMVRDVLSYPHAQLQSSIKGVANDQIDIETQLDHSVQVNEVLVPVSPPTNFKLLPDSNIFDHEVIKNSKLGQVEINDRLHSPPPIVDDGESAIFASSSPLSTTEPSIVSSSEDFIASHLENGLSIPQPGEHYPIGTTTSQAFSTQFMQSEGDIMKGMDARGLWASFGTEPKLKTTPHVSHADGFDQAKFEADGPIAISNKSPLHTHVHQLQRQGQHPQTNTQIILQQQRSPDNPNHHAHIIQHSFVPAGQMTSEPPLQSNTYDWPNYRPNLANNQMNVDGHSSVCGGPSYNLHSSETVAGARTIVTAPLSGLMPHAGVDSGPSGSSPQRNSRITETDNWMWTSRDNTHSSPSLPLEPSELQPLSSSGFAAASIGFASEQSTKATTDNSFSCTNPQVLPSEKALPIVNLLSTTANSSGSIPLKSRNNDSQIIDSLFGGSTHAHPVSVNNTNELFEGFNGVPLNTSRDGTKRSGLWGSSKSTETWNDSKESMMNGKEPAVPSITNMFSSEIPNPFCDHPQESRFNWD